MVDFFGDIAPKTPFFFEKKMERGLVQMGQFAPGNSIDRQIREAMMHGAKVTVRRLRERLTAMELVGGRPAQKVQRRLLRAILDTIDDEAMGL
jgi:hypothetical protein